LLTAQESLDLRLRDAMVTAFRARGSHLASVDPSLQRRVRDPELLGGGPDSEETHLLPILRLEPE